MKKLLREPLLHFLVAGAALFLLFEVAGNDEQAYDSKVIEVDRDALLTFIQFRTRAFEPSIAEARLAELSEEALARLIDDYVREEALYREALALGMDKNDYVIKRRMVQSVEFITNGFVAAATEVSDEDLRRQYDENREDYYIDPIATFTHVFYNAQRHGDEQARGMALAKLAELNRDGVNFNEAPRHGERFPYLLNYVERTPDYIASHFGAETAESIFALEPDENTWAGPFVSSYGVHLVLLTNKADGRYPDLDEVKDRVRQDVERVKLNEAQDRAVQAIVDTYDVRRSYNGAPLSVD